MAISPDLNAYDILQDEALPVISKQFKTDLEVDKVAVTHDLFSSFVASLDEETEKIHQLYLDKNYELLADVVHYIHGAACYCGVPRLRKAISMLALAAREKNDSTIAELLAVFDSEVALVMEYARRQGIVEKTE